MTEQGGEAPKKVDPIAKGVGIGCLGVIAAVVALVIVGLAIGDDGDQSGQVKVACHGWVKDRLKSPSSAKFANDSIKRDDSTYTLTGSVDSQNGFGAMIRNDYTCVATNTGDSTSLVSLNGLTN